MKIVPQRIDYLVRNNRIYCHYYYDIITKNKEKKNNNLQVAIGYTDCDENEEFDFKRGTKIALAKAERIAYRQVYTRIKKIVNMMEEKLSEYNAFITKSKDIISHNGKYISVVANDIELNKK